MILQEVAWVTAGIGKSDANSWWSNGQTQNGRTQDSISSDLSLARLELILTHQRTALGLLGLGCVLLT